MKFSITKKAKRVAISALMMAAVTAHAQTSGGGWKGVGNNLGDLGNTMIWAVIVLCGVAGVGAIGFAGKLLLKKAGDRGDDVEWSKIGYATIAGAFFLSVTYIATLTVETMGGSQNTMGKTITITR